MDESKWGFILENWGLVIKVAEIWKKKVGPKVDMDELVSGAVELATKCLRTWTPERGTFSTYYYNAARNHGHLRNVIYNTQTAKGVGHIGSLNEVTSIHDDHTDEAVDMISCTSETDEAAISNAMSKKLHAAIAQLPPRLRRHAHQTLSGEVDWKNLDSTVKQRQEMLELLRQHMEE